MTKVAEASRLDRRAVGIARQNPVYSVLLLAVLIPSAVIGVLTVVVAAVLAPGASELIANGVGAARAKAATA